MVGAEMRSERLSVGMKKKETRNICGVKVKYSAVKQRKRTVMSLVNVISKVVHTAGE